MVIGGRKASCQGWSCVKYQVRAQERQKAKERGERTLCSGVGRDQDKSVLISYQKKVSLVSVPY